jgi:transcription termination factor NusB
METLKKAYINKKLERKEKLKNITLRYPQKDSYFEYSGGRGVLPLASNTTDEDPLEEALDDIAKGLSLSGMDKEADFINHLISKFANINYFDKAHDKLTNIFENSDEEYGPIMYEFGRKFMRRYMLELQSGKTPDLAAEFAYSFANTDKNINKMAQQMEANPVYVADQILDIIRIMIARMNPEYRMSSLEKIKSKVLDMSANEMSEKKMTGGAGIGTTIALIKNILNGSDIYFINIVIDELVKKLI